MDSNTGYQGRNVCELDVSVEACFLEIMDKSTTQLSETPSVMFELDKCLQDVICALDYKL